MDQGWLLRWSGRVAAVSGAVFLGTFTAMVAAPPTAGAALASTTTTVQVVSADPTAGQAIAVQASVRPVPPETAIPTGTVDFLVDGAPQTSGALDGAGNATAMITTATPGTHTVRAIYMHQGNFSRSTGAVGVAVADAVVLVPPTIVTNEPPQIGDPASVSNTPAAPPQQSTSPPARSASQLPNTGPASGSQLPNTGAPSPIVWLLGVISAASGLVAVCVARVTRLWRSSLG